MDEEDNEYTLQDAFDQAQAAASKGLKALERVHFHLDANASDEVYEALEDVYHELAGITWL